MEALIVLTLLGIFWLISPKRWRRWVLAPISIVALISIVITSPIGIALVTQGLMATLPPDVGEPVQSIVVLGRGDELRQRRIEMVEQLWRQQRAPRIFASGMLDAEFIVEQLQGNGIPKAAVSGERCSQSTLENALFTSAVLHPQQIHRILLVTDAPHMLRSLLVFRASGFTVIPYSIALSPQQSSAQQSLVVLREYLGLAGYTIAGHFKQRSATELSQPPTEVTRKLVEWNCKL